MFYILYILCSLSVIAYGEDYTVENYPNPKKGGFKECGMKYASNVCDPEETLNESERNRIQSQIMKFSKQSEEGGNTFCSRKGTDVIFVIHTQASQQFADGLRQKWNMDAQCGRSGILVLSLNDRKMYGSFDEKTSIKSSELHAIIATEDELIQTGQYTKAVGNVLKELAAKQNPLTTGSSTTSRPDRTKKSASNFVPIFAIIFTLLISQF